MKTTAIHNGTDDKKTIAALKKAAGNASGKARRVIQGLAKALNPNTAARGRNAKGDASMAKKRTRRATAKRRTASNPTPKRRTWRRKSNPTGFAAKVKGLDLKGIFMEGAGVAAGAIATSFVNRQAERMFPNLSPALRSTLATALVAGGLGYASGGRGFLKNMAVGGTAEGIRAILASLMPGMLGEVDEFAPVGEIAGWNPDGTWNEELGAFVEDEPIEGVLFDRSQPVAVQRSF